MKHAVVRLAVVVGLVGSAVVAPVFAAEETTKTLPTLLIKGEVVSNDTSDPAATLLKVKDRYGFETPIYLTQATKIAQGDQIVVASALAAGTPVEVEYNFDINTAKRQAVNVKIGAQGSSGAVPAAGASVPAAVPSSTAAPSSAPASDTAVVPAPTTPAATPAAPASPAASTPAAPAASSSPKPAGSAQ